MDRNIEDLNILELKGVLYDLGIQSQQVIAVIQRKTQEEQKLKDLQIIDKSKKDK